MKSARLEGVCERLRQELAVLLNKRPGAFSRRPRKGTTGLEAVGEGPYSEASAPNRPALESPSGTGLVLPRSGCAAFEVVGEHVRGGAGGVLKRSDVGCASLIGYADIHSGVDENTPWGRFQEIGFR